MALDRRILRLNGHPIEVSVYSGCSGYDFIVNTVDVDPRFNRGLTYLETLKTITHFPKEEDWRKFEKQLPALLDNATKIGHTCNLTLRRNWELARVRHYYGFDCNIFEALYAKVKEEIRNPTLTSYLALTETELIVI